MNRSLIVQISILGMILVISYFAFTYINKNSNDDLIGNSIQKKVWNELKKIKFGKTKSYGAIAKKYKLSPRHVGKICSQNKIPLAIPCHRVINNNGNIGGFTSVGGIKLKKKLLEFEKIN